MIGKLEVVELREIWKHEAFDFTAWLFENCDILNEQIGLSITPIEKEKSVGPFNADILAEDTNGRPVIIENQIERTDHDHLGKILTYLSNTAFVAMKEVARVELYLYGPTAETIKKRFDKLASQKKEIEEAFGEPLL